MNLSPDNWRPSPQEIAAYFDGELVGSPERDALRLQIEGFLAQDAEARAELIDLDRLGQLWRETTPPPPPRHAWKAIKVRLRDQVSRLPRLRRRRWVAALLATAAVLGLFIGIEVLRRGTSGTPPDTPAPKPAPPAPVAEIEVFPVATAAEVTILLVEGADTPTVPVGRLPVDGLIELAGPGEVVLTSVQPDARDNMLPQVRLDGPSRPMIWARVDSDVR
jgi:hypothetical protein